MGVVAMLTASTSVAQPHALLALPRPVTVSQPPSSNWRSLAPSPGLQQFSCYMEYSRARSDRPRGREASGPRVLRRFSSSDKRVSAAARWLLRRTSSLFAYGNTIYKKHLPRHITFRAPWNDHNLSGSCMDGEQHCLLTSALQVLVEIQLDFCGA